MGDTNEVNAESEKMWLVQNRKIRSCASVHWETSLSATLRLAPAWIYIAQLAGPLLQAVYSTQWQNIFQQRPPLCPPLHPHYYSYNPASTLPDNLDKEVICTVDPTLPQVAPNSGARPASLRLTRALVAGVLACLEGGGFAPKVRYWDGWVGCCLCFVATPASLVTRGGGSWFRLVRRGGGDKGVGGCGVVGTESGELPARALHGLTGAVSSSEDDSASCFSTSGGRGRRVLRSWGAAGAEGGTNKWKNRTIESTERLEAKCWKAAYWAKSPPNAWEGEIRILSATLS